MDNNPQQLRLDVEAERLSRQRRMLACTEQACATDPGDEQEYVAHSKGKA